MINFEKLVLEAIAAGSTEPIQSFIQDSGELVDLKQNLNEFGITQAMLVALPLPWYRKLDEQILLRFTLSVASSLEYINVFPYVDFLCLVKQSFNVKFVDPVQKESLETTEIVFNEGSSGMGILNFDSRKSGPGNHPFFNYTPCSNLLKAEYPRIKQEIVNSNIIGKMVVNNLQSTSVKKAIYTVVNLLQPTPKANVPENDDKINNVLINPNNYLPGQPTILPLPQEIKNVGAKFFNLANTLNQLVETSARTEGTLEFITTKTIANIKSDTSDEAKEFIKLLEQLANVIPKTPTKEWSKILTGVLSGAAQIAKGLSLGVPTMGR